MDAYWIKTEDIRVAIMPRPRGGEWLANDIESLKRSGVKKIVSLLTPGEVEELSLSEEEKVCGKHGLEFCDFPIEDRSVPIAPREFREFICRLNTEARDGKSWRFTAGQESAGLASLPLAF